MIHNFYNLSKFKLNQCSGCLLAALHFASLSYERGVHVRAHSSTEDRTGWIITEILEAHAALFAANVNETIK